MKTLLILLFPILTLGQKLEKLTDGHYIPWGMVFIDEENILFTERGGNIKVFNLKSKTTQQAQGSVKTLAQGQGGLLDVALDPDFKSNKKIYYTYSKEIGDKNTTALATATLENKQGQWAVTNMKDIFLAEPAVEGTTNHYGSRLVVTDKEIWMTMGDRYTERDSAQDLSTHLGKLLRLNHNGKAMADNPFVKQKGAKPEVWSYGHRNPQGLLRHPKTGDIWLHEHGPRGGDEINLIKKGANYGWPLVSFGKEYSGGTISKSPYKEGTEKPAYQYTPSIAPCGFAFYGGSKIPAFENSFLIGALALTHLNQVPVNGQELGKEKRYFEKQGPRIREVEVGPDELVYFSTDAGEIWRVHP